MANLTVYLKRKEIQALGPAGNRGERLRRARIGGAGKGIADRPQGFARHRHGLRRHGRSRSATTCDVHLPRFADEVIGRGGPSISPAAASAGTAAEMRYASALCMALSPAERMAYWATEFERCVKCYACRQVCPMCYCERCMVDKNRPTVIEPSATLKGNFAWHITARLSSWRAAAWAAANARAPVRRALTCACSTFRSPRPRRKTLAYRAGMDPKAEPLIGSYSLQDKEDFIR